MSGKPQIAILAKIHDTTEFDCGSDELNRFLKQHARQNQKADASKTYVAVLGDNRVVGFYSLAAGQILRADAPDYLTKGMPRYPVIPAMLLARLARDLPWRGKGLGNALLVDAVRRTVTVADQIGIKALVVDAKDETAKEFYEHYEFQPLVDKPFTLYRTVKDLRAMLQRN